MDKSLQRPKPRCVDFTGHMYYEEEPAAIYMNQLEKIIKEQDAKLDRIAKRC